MDSDDASYGYVAVVTEEVSKFIFLIYMHIYSMSHQYLNISICKKPCIIII